MKQSTHFLFFNPLTMKLTVCPGKLTHNPGELASGKMIAVSYRHSKILQM